MTGQRLEPAALAFRTAHAGIALGFLTAIAYVWACVLTGRRDRWLRAAVAALTIEGAVVSANGGDCPLGPLQDRLDDPVPLFELVLSPRAARRAVPVLGAVAAVGIGLLARPKPREPLHGGRRWRLHQRLERRLHTAREDDHRAVRLGRQAA